MRCPVLLVVKEQVCCFEGHEVIITLIETVLACVYANTNHKTSFEYPHESDCTYTTGIAISYFLLMLFGEGPFHSWPVLKV